MSFDLVLRSDAEYSRTVSNAALVALVSSLPQVQPNGGRWALCDGPVSAPRRLWMDIGWSTIVAGGEERVEKIQLKIPYGFFKQESAGEYLATARRMAELLGGWEIFDEQTGRVVGEGERLKGAIPQLPYPFNRTAIPTAQGRAAESGEALLVWGEGDRDALLLKNAEEARRALTALRASVGATPLWFRLWSRRDELLFGVITREEWSLQAVWPNWGCASSRGDDAQSETFEGPTISGARRQIPWSECVEWPLALEAAAEFANSGSLGHLPRREFVVQPDVKARASGGRASEGRAAVPAALEESSLRDWTKG
jgi:hypothetical protein